jgi:hypothetical protein
VESAEDALDAAREKHNKVATDLRKQIEALEQKVRAEDQRWEKERGKLETALKRARN